MNNTCLSEHLLSPEISSIWYSTVSIRFFLFRYDRLTIFSKLSPGISPSVWICNASSSRFVRMGMYFPPRSEVSYVFGVPNSYGTSSSSSSSSSSVSVSLAFRFWTILSFPLNMSRCISSQRPYSPSRPRKQCLFFGLISPLVLIVGSFFVLRSV